MLNDLGRQLLTGVDALMSDEILEVISGGFDLHTHTSPDIVERSQTITETAADFARHRLGGFVVKSHVVPTTLLVAGAQRDLPATPLPSITLNRTVGGLNPVAVEAAAVMGARVVWLPTKDSRLQHQHEGQASHAHLNVLVGGQPSEALHEVIATAAAHQMTIATGHLGEDEVFAVLAVAREHGADNVIVTHPCLPHLRISDSAIAEMAARGAWIEHTMNSLATGKVGLDHVLDLIERCGTASTLLTGDLGQPEFGSIAGGLVMWAVLLLRAGCSPFRVREMIVSNSRHTLRL
ncbi:hypothetical protein D3I60_01980 [Brevibacterium permense]|uniref:DUF6282 family protein n=1 Tax=Brevibacterium permense TaxID=234834 RepID=UPI0021D2025C|nr:DUF6282 family protein [Brevibacterium permense]MCU4295860.1 hypothetical protein [Brevibacterium permense]